MEEVAYDPDSGQLLTGSFMDYALPRADDLPNFGVRATDVPCPSNPLGVKGCGEAGAIAACATLINAIVDALAGLGVEHVDMPATPEAVWRAIGARAAATRG
jgi:carbon-monoxide dehydrogenase large subunit